MQGTLTTNFPGTRKVTLFSTKFFPHYFKHSDLRKVREEIIKTWSNVTFLDIDGEPEKGLYRVRIEFEKKVFIVWHVIKNYEE